MVKLDLKANLRLNTGLGASETSNPSPEKSSSSSVVEHPSDEPERDEAKDDQEASEETELASSSSSSSIGSALLAVLPLDDRLLKTLLELSLDQKEALIGTSF